MIPIVRFQEDTSFFLFGWDNWHCIVFGYGLNGPASIHVKIDTGQESRLIAGQEKGGIGHVNRLGKSAKRDIGEELLSVLGSVWDACETLESEKKEDCQYESSGRVRLRRLTGLYHTVRGKCCLHEFDEARTQARDLGLPEERIIC